MATVALSLVVLPAEGQENTMGRSSYSSIDLKCSNEIILNLWNSSLEDSLRDNLVRDLVALSDKYSVGLNLNVAYESKAIDMPRLDNLLYVKGETDIKNDSVHSERKMKQRKGNTGLLLGLLGAGLAGAVLLAISDSNNNCC